jgi:F-type H+-transporting ATPase subunit b
MTRFRRACLAGLLLLTLLWAPIATYAGGEEPAQHQQAVEIFEWINFAIVAGLLSWVFLKATPPFFRARSEAIVAAIGKATAAKAEADRQLREAEGRLSRLQNEVKELRTAAEQEAKAEAERIRSLTQADAQRVSDAAKAEIEAAERAARMELKARAANLAVDAAESLLKRQLTPQTQEALLAGFVQTLEGRPN